MKNLVNALLTIFLAVSAHPSIAEIKPAPLVSIPTHDSFFDSIAKHCGKAFAGKVVLDTDHSPVFQQPLIMHVRKCSDVELQIPFHVGEDASRTWIITKTGSGLSLKHDHRKPDGSYDPLTMYGGHTFDAGSETEQAFPADQYSKELFVTLDLLPSVLNTWQMRITPKIFTYRLVREGREFTVDFDLSRPIKTPTAPWGYADWALYH